MYKMITADMTDEQIQAPAKRAREEMLTVALEAQESEFLQGDKFVRAAQSVKNAEAVAGAAHTLLRMRQNEKSDMDILLYLMGLLTRGADDTWSGRGNDSNREAHDAVRKFAEDQADHIRYGNQHGTN